MTVLERKCNKLIGQRKTKTFNKMPTDHAYFFSRLQAAFPDCLIKGTGKKSWMGLTVSGCKLFSETNCRKSFVAVVIC